MNAIQRVGVTLTSIALSLVLFTALTYAGARSQGPIEGALIGVGEAVSSVESLLANRVRGSSRSDELGWFAPYRTDTERLRQPEHVLLGAFDDGLPTSVEGVWALEEALGTRFPLVHFFTAWGSKPHQQFPARTVQAIARLGSVPVITWEPWLGDFSESAHPALPPASERDAGGMAAVARGDYDFYLERWARDAAEHGQPIFVRLGHEMNDAYRYSWGPHNNRTEDYVEMYRHVVRTFREAGADNVIWVWSPHVAYEGFEAYYPGGDVVDWVATTALNYGNVAYWSAWWSFEEIFERKYEQLRAFGKPIMIAEFGTIMAGGERAPWMEAALTNLPERLPEVKALVFFHNARDETITYQPLNWAFASDSSIVAIVRRSIESWAPGPTCSNLASLQPRSRCAEPDREQQS
jgi:hypothetical protein